MGIPNLDPPLPGCTLIPGNSNVLICKSELTLPPCSVVEGDDAHETACHGVGDRVGAHWVGFIPPFLTELTGPSFTWSLEHWAPCLLPRSANAICKYALSGTIVHIMDRDERDLAAV